jgi:hypothetical protein
MIGQYVASAMVKSLKELSRLTTAIAIERFKHPI